MVTAPLQGGHREVIVGSIFIEQRTGSRCPAMLQLLISTTYRKLGSGLERWEQVRLVPLEDTRQAGGHDGGQQPSGEDEPE